MYWSLVRRPCLAVFTLPRNDTAKCIFNYFLAVANIMRMGFVDQVPRLFSNALHHADPTVAVVNATFYMPLLILIIENDTIAMFCVWCGMMSSSYSPQASQTLTQPAWMCAGWCTTVQASRSTTTRCAYPHVCAISELYTLSYFPSGFHSSAFRCPKRGSYFSHYRIVSTRAYISCLEVFTSS